MRKLMAIGLTLLMISILALSCAKEEAPPAPAPPAPPAAPAKPAAPAPPAKELPDLLTFTTSTIGTSTYTYCAGITSAIEGVTGVKARAIPSGGDVGRLVAVRAGEVQGSFGTSSSQGNAIFGRQDFCKYAIGPTAFRLVWSGAPTILGSPVRADSGIETGYDLKGKRVGYVPGHSSVWATRNSMLNFYDLTIDDVELVPCAGMKSSYTSVKEGRADVTSGWIFSADMYDLEASPHGIRWLAMPADNKKGWDAFNAYGPFFSPITVTEGAGISADNPAQVYQYGFGVIVGKAVDDDLAYFLTKAIWDGYDLYEGKHKTLALWTHEQALDTSGLINRPYHDGSVKFFKDQGAWTDENEKKNQALIARQKLLLKTWGEEVDKALAQEVAEADFADIWSAKLQELVGLKPVPAMP